VGETNLSGGNMKNMNWKRFVLICILLITLNPVALPQSPNGTVSGRVLDEKGEVIAKARLTLINKGTSLKRYFFADENGSYTFISVPPGSYLLTAENKGFSTAKIDNVEVKVAGQTEIVDISLKAGGMNEVVIIGAGSDSVNRTLLGVSNDSATLGTGITREQISELPSLTRNLFEFVVLSAGASPTSEGRGLGIAVNGQRSASGNYVLDGGENNSLFSAGPAQNLSQESVKEFVILTNNYTAEYGRNAGFVANIVSNVGTNDYHFNLFDFIRNSALAANNFDNNAQGRDANGKANAPRPDFNRHQFGGSLGGHLAKEKLFFFTAVEPIIVRSSGSLKFFVPTKQLVDLSVAGTKEIFKQAQAILRRQNSSAFLPDGKQSGTITIDICPSGANCNPTNGQGFVPVPAYAPISVSGPSNFGAGYPQNSVLASGRLDYNINEKMQLFGRYSLEYSDIFGRVNQPYSEDLYQDQKFRSQNVQLNLTRIWSNNLVTESRAIYGRAREEQEATAKIGDPTKGYLPNFGLFGNASGVSIPFGSNQFFDLQNIYQLYQTATFTKEQHLFKFGAQYFHAREAITPPVLNELPTARIFGIQDFVNGRIGNYVVTFDSQGKNINENVVAPFTVGTIKRHYNYNEASLFAQDTWKIHPRLTLTPGVRWEYFGVFHSVRSEKDLDANFYYGEGNNLYERIRNGKFYRVNEAPGKYKGHFYLPDYKNFAPRMGIAWDIFGTGKTILRSGAGVFYDRNFGNVLANVSVNPPSTAQVNFALSLTPDLVKNPFAFIPAGAAFTLQNPSGRHIDQDLKTSYTVSVNASLEHKLNSSVLVGLTYVGAKADRLNSINDINKPGSALTYGYPATDFRMGLVENVAELNSRGNLGDSTYHSMQIKVETNRLKSLGLQFGANYTWSHSIDTASSAFYDDFTANPVGIGFLDVFNPSLDKGDSDFDIRHRLVTNFIWQIPFAENLNSRFAKAVLNGWEVSGILSFQTGQPFSIYYSGTPGYDTYSSPRPILLNSFFPTYKSLAPLRPDATQPNTFQYLLYDLTKLASLDSVNGPFDGAISRNTFRRPGTQYHNLAVMRNFTLPKIFGREGAKLQLRGEFYNAFNHANLYVNLRTNDIFGGFFNNGTEFVPAVTASRGKQFNLLNRGGTTPLSSFVDNRQIVIAAKFTF
jgi:hypothetical protein